MELNLFKWKQFESEIILLTVRWYLRYSLSYRDLVEMMEERGLHIAHTTIMRWVHEFGPELDWNKEELMHFLEIAERETSYFVALHIAAFTGMRQGEILGLRWADVDLERCVISVVQTMSHDGKELKIGAKSASGNRTISIPDETVTLLRKHRKLQLEEKVKTEAGKTFNPDDLVICTSYGTWTTPRILSKAYQVIIKKSAVPKIRFHDIRHTHATLLLEIGEHPKVVQERMGHSSIQLTMDTYSHVSQNMQSNTAKMFGEYLKKEQCDSIVTQSSS